MFSAPIRQFDEAQVIHRLEQVLGDIDTGNGTPLAAAAATALLTDAAATRNGLPDVLALDDDALFHAAAQLHYMLTEGRHESKLPFGSSASSYDPGGVKVAGEMLVLEAGRPGLHPMESTRRDAHGPNLELLRRLITRKTRRLACRRIGLPSAKTIVDTDERTMLQFPPFAEAGGMVLQRRTCDTGAPRFCSATTRQIEAFATSIVEDMRALWTRRAEIGERAMLVRRSAEAGILAECGPEADIAVSCISIELGMQREDRDPSVYIEYDCLDEALRRGTVIDYLPGRNEATPRNLRRIPRVHRERTAELEELRSAGAAGRIDDVAAAIASAAPGGLVAVLAKLSENYDAFVTIPTSGAPLYATLYWRDGVIKAEADCRDRLDYCRERLELRNVQLPDTVVETLAGRWVSETAELPFDLTCRITGGRENDASIVLDLDVGTSLVNCTEGRIWPQPADGDFGETWLRLPPPYDER
ncbi:hypothetical protein [Sphingomonas lacusdianchii]|uniref:hypothetical protein n=1 Tax=Sphingomonas lacusdianchii TaxID=2917992 RepID=UPI001F58F75B|nr:hypothetical protein [Sphingomonas sp. JXJ CY 53]